MPVRIHKLIDVFFDRVLRYLRAEVMEIIFVLLEEFFSENKLSNPSFSRIKNSVAIQIESLCKLIILLRNIPVQILLRAIH